MNEYFHAQDNLGGLNTFIIHTLIIAEMYFLYKDYKFHVHQCQALLKISDLTFMGDFDLPFVNI